jgi:hypothetical protein
MQKRCLACFQLDWDTEDLDLGHDPMAHRIYRILLRESLSRADLETMTDKELGSRRNVGRAVIYRIRTQVPAAAADAT